MEDLFAPPGTAWVRLSPKLRALRRLLLLVVLGPVVAAGVVVAWVLVGPWLGVLAALVGGALGAWWWFVIGRAWRAWGYAERDEDLVVTHGVLIRRLSVVPYGRLQFADVTAGPLDRQFGIATVQLHTASAATDAMIPGLTPGEAARLRDRLSAVGQARSAGL